jgi:SAM-dependent methyltransferase
MKESWFKRWFGEHYKRLYPHRDLREAECQVDPLLRILPVTPEWRILDVGCGSGRHLEVLRRRGRGGLAGVDLSLPLLRDARARRLPVVRADMRRLPFRSGGFDLVTSFFTSFGYFATFEEDVDALGQFVSALRPGGYLFLDLPNADRLLRNLVPSDVRMVDGAMVEQRRRIEEEVRGGAGAMEPESLGPRAAGRVVIKDIEIRRPSGEVERFEERVRLYTLAEMAAHGARFGLSHLATYGDEAGGAWDPEHSPRMALLFRLREA